MLEEIQSVLNQGGTILWMLILLGIGLYSILAATWFGLRKVRSEMQKEQFDGCLGKRELVRQFAVFELDRLAWVERRLPFIAVLAGAAPLAGLLGTVSGMLVTFSGLASSSHAKPIDKISVGISEALITTQAGLLIAIPAAILRRQTSSTHATLQQRLHASLVTSSQQLAASGS
ncbi:MAG: MotA/TolQ/ExbB proton channel family protein [Akkermansiaceae bacterium]